MAVSWWTVIKAIIVIIPSIIAMVKEGKIKEASMDEVLEALAELFDARIKAAVAAREAAGNMEWDNDPNDRANWPNGAGASSGGLSDPLGR